MSQCDVEILINECVINECCRMFFFAAGREVFREFLRSEYSEENMLFWLAVEDLRKETDAQLVEEKARLIYEDYISILSPKEVGVVARNGSYLAPGF